MSKFIKILLIVLVILFIIGCVTTNSNVGNNFCTFVESFAYVVSGIVMNIVHGFTWIIHSICNLF